MESSETVHDSNPVALACKSLLYLISSQEVAKEILDRYGRLDLYINTVGILQIPDGIQPGMCFCITISIV